MLHRYLMIVPVAAFVTMGVVAHGRNDTRNQIVSAAIAPYIAFAHDDPDALCEDFVPKVAARLGRQISGDNDCVTRVMAAYARGKLLRRFPGSRFAGMLVVNDVTWNDGRAKVILSYRIRAYMTRFQMALAERGGRWRVSTPPVLAVIKGCLDYEGLLPCRRSLNVLVFEVAKPLIPGQPRIVPPAAVRRAGGKELREFEFGSRVAVASGCLACHRIGMQGKGGPGPPLTKVGALLSQQQIENVIVAPKAPMPSFRNLSRKRLAALVKFLSLLK